VATPAGSAGRSGHGFSGAAGLCPVAERGGPLRHVFCGGVAPGFSAGSARGRAFLSGTSVGQSLFVESVSIGANDLTGGGGVL
jgi:hypothetical protein